jgi:hypothetical protein
MIGGLIILSLILTALGTMVFVSQQYDQYQQLVKRVGQYDSQQLSESLVINSPGLTILTSPPSSGWGSSCTTTYNCYNISISNVGGVGVQIARIYINSTGTAGSGCSSPNPQPCILTPTSTIASYAFNRANQFVNPGEVNHAVLFALPFALPDPSPAVPQNSILIATSRGNVFSFQWPVPLQVFGQSGSAFSSGNMKVAYQSISGGYDSKNEPGVGGSGTSATGYCHKESLQNYPAASNYAEELTGITGVGVTGNALYFVSPWVTNTILTSTINGATQMYIYILVTNTGKTPYTPIAGSIDLTWYGSNHLDGTLLGVYYKGTFYSTASAPSYPNLITQSTSYYAIYKINQATTKYGNPLPQGAITAAMFWGDASINDWAGSCSSSCSWESYGYYSATMLVAGLWIRAGC